MIDDPLKTFTTNKVDPDGGRWFSSPSANPSDTVSLPTLVRGKTYVAPVWLGRDQTVSFSELGVRVQTAGAGSVIRMGVFELDEEDDFRPKSLLIDAGTVASATTGEKYIAISLTTVDIPWIGMAIQAEGSATPPAVSSYRTVVTNTWPSLFGSSSINDPGNFLNMALGIAANTIVGDGSFQLTFSDYAIFNCPLPGGYIRRSV